MNLKIFLKKYNYHVKFKRYFDRLFLSTRFNILNFPIYNSSSAWRYKDQEHLTISAINNIFPTLSKLAYSLNKKEIKTENIKSLCNNDSYLKSANAIKDIFDSQGSDKSTIHNYHFIYGYILNNNHNIKNIFEIGLGTNNTDIVSSMGSQGKPGASLRAFREFCPNAHIYGADIDKRILFQEERIKTFYVDQTDLSTFEELIKLLPNNFDLFIDDGLHAPHANIASLMFGLNIIRSGGWCIIEDIENNAITIWQVIAALLPPTYRCHILMSDDDNQFVFAVQKL